MLEGPMRIVVFYTERTIHNIAVNQRWWLRRKINAHLVVCHVFKFVTCKPFWTIGTSYRLYYHVCYILSILQLKGELNAKCCQYLNTAKNTSFLRTTDFCHSARDRHPRNFLMTPDDSEWLLGSYTLFCYMV